MCGAGRPLVVWVGSIMVRIGGFYAVRMGYYAGRRSVGRVRWLWCGQAGSKVVIVWVIGRAKERARSDK